MGLSLTLFLSLSVYIQCIYISICYAYAIGPVCVLYLIGRAALFPWELIRMDPTTGTSLLLRYLQGRAEKFSCKNSLSRPLTMNTSRAERHTRDQVPKDEEGISVSCLAIEFQLTTRLMLLGVLIMWYPRVVLFYSSALG